MSDSEERVEPGLAAWRETIADLNELAAEREADGWQTVCLQAGDTAPVSPAVGESDRFGYVYTVSNDVVDEFEAVFDAGTFDSFTVYRKQLGETLFLITEVTDSKAEVSILIAGAVDLDSVDALKEAAMEAGEMYTHVQLLDWTHLGSFSHDDPSAFFATEE